MEKEEPNVGLGFDHQPSSALHHSLLSILELFPRFYHHGRGVGRIFPWYEHIRPNLKMDERDNGWWRRRVRISWGGAEGWDLADEDEENGG